jgi:hypothetical protein
MLCHTTPKGTAAIPRLNRSLIGAMPRAQQRTLHFTSPFMRYPILSMALQEKSGDYLINGGFPERWRFAMLCPGEVHQLAARDLPINPNRTSRDRPIRI